MIYGSGLWALALGFRVKVPEIYGSGALELRL